MEVKFDGNIDLRRGEIIKIIRAVPNDSFLIRATVFENITTGQTFKSHFEGVIAVNPPQTLAEPIIGKVKSVRNNSYSTTFEIEPGIYQDHIFVRAGEKEKGQDALIDILKNQLSTYVKIWDPYIGPDTIKLISNVPSNIDILILTENIADRPNVIANLASITNKISIRKGSGFHDRFILTKGEG